MYGAQTMSTTNKSVRQFENDVEMYGAQTHQEERALLTVFENDVEMYGAQTVCPLSG